MWAASRARRPLTRCSSQAATSASPASQGARDAPACLAPPELPRSGARAEPEPERRPGSARAPRKQRLRAASAPPSTARTSPERCVIARCQACERDLRSDLSPYLHEHPSGDTEVGEKRGNDQVLMTMDKVMTRAHPRTITRTSIHGGTFRRHPPALGRRPPERSQAWTRTQAQARTPAGLRPGGRHTTGGSHTETSRDTSGATAWAPGPPPGHRQGHRRSLAGGRRSCRTKVRRKPTPRMTRAKLRTRERHEHGKRLPGWADPEKTHSPKLRYTAVLETHGCGWSCRLRGASLILPTNRGTRGRTNPSRSATTIGHLISADCLAGSACARDFVGVSAERFEDHPASCAAHGLGMLALLHKHALRFLPRRGMAVSFAPWGRMSNFGAGSVVDLPINGSRGLGFGR